MPRIQRVEVIENPWTEPRYLDRTNHTEVFATELEEARRVLALLPGKHQRHQHTDTILI